MSITQYIDEIRILRLLLLVFIVASMFIEVLERGVYLYIFVYLLFIVLIAIGKPYHIFISTIAFSAIYTLDGELLALLLTIASSLLSFLILYAEGRSGILKLVFATLLFYTPIYIVNPRTLISVATVVGCVVIAVAREYLRIGKSYVEIYQHRKTVYIGEPASYGVDIKCRGIFRYIVLESRRSIASGEAVNEVRVDLPVRTNYLGVNNIHISVVIEDVRGFARVTHGPYTLSYVVLAKASILMKRAERLLEKYAAYLAVPRVVKIMIGFHGLGEVGGSAELAGAGISGSPGVGIAGLGGESLGKISKELAASIATGVGIEGVEQPILIREKQGFVKYALAIHIMKEVEATISRIASRAYIGEYQGVREYIPGDNIKAIHWKKSFRRELVEDIYVKVFSSESEGGGGWGVRVIYADLAATSPRELDVLISAIYGELLRELEGGKPFTTVHLFIYIPYRELHYIHGKLVDVVVALNTLIQRYEARALYDYDTWRRTRTIRLGEAQGFLNKLEEYYRVLGLALADVVKKEVGRNTSITLIHSNALAYKYAIVAKILRDAGFMVPEPVR